MQFFLSLLLGMLDRLRGSTWAKPVKPITKLLMGACLYIIWSLQDLGAGDFWGLYQDPEFYLFMLAMLAGSSIGWGNAIGPFLTGNPPSQYPGQNGLNDPGPEVWQVGFLKESAIASVAVAGAIWGSAFFLFTLNTAFLILVPIYVISSVTACTISKNIYKNNKKTDKAWGLQEGLRGFLVGLLVILWQSV